MPKKLQGENTKAVAAKARKAAEQSEKLAAKQQAEEDAYWEDDDKHVKKKQLRKGNKDKKKEDQTSRKQEARRLLEEEEAAIKVSSKGAGVKPGKLTRAQIQADQEREAAAEAAERKKQEPTTHLDAPLEENPNLLLAEQEAEGYAIGRNVEEAIGALSVKESAVEKHPEKRVKAAFKTFEELHFPRLKAENPNLRMSQLKQMLKKDWVRSPDNPLNQRTAEYNAK